jgi:hypothetical protein
MPARIRRLATNVVRLNTQVFVQVQNLAGLAGVSPSEIVEFVMMEVLQDDPGFPVLAPSCPVPVAPGSPRPGLRKTPARVSPIGRRQARRASVGCLSGSRTVDLGETRRHASELRRRSQEARGRAESVRRKAAQARARAEELLAGFGWH